MAAIVAHDFICLAVRQFLVVALLLSLAASPIMVTADASAADGTQHSPAETAEAAAAGATGAAAETPTVAASEAAVAADPEPYCEDLSRGPLVREIRTLYQDSYGMEGVAVITLGGKVQHGLKHVEVFMMTFAPGAKTPIHSHPQEEVVVITRGEGKVWVVEEKKTEPSAHAVKRNTTVTFQPKALHQIVNDGKEELQLIASYSKPPHKMAVHATWQTARKDAESAGRASWDACVVREGEGGEAVEGERGAAERKQGGAAETAANGEAGAATGGNVVGEDATARAEEDELRRDLEGDGGEVAGSSQEVKDEL
ncbi:unnamed protein product [Closterium sp. NIES-64]|nr:unnamed protein product [Closterium sp. NIES-64]CAI5978973.1 unnamed protein product [Closterium sp. NIES-65]